jgi:hypothetical protein
MLLVLLVGRLSLDSSARGSKETFKASRGVGLVAESFVFKELRCMLSVWFREAAEIRGLL